MKIPAETLVELIVTRVLEELAKRGVEVEVLAGSPPGARHVKVFDMAGYKTPVLAERHLQSLDPRVEEIEIPAGTVVTPGAREIIKHRKLTVHRKQNA